MVIVKERRNILFRYLCGRLPDKKYCTNIDREKERGRQESEGRRQKAKSSNCFFVLYIVQAAKEK